VARRYAGIGLSLAPLLTRAGLALVLVTVGCAVTDPGQYALPEPYSYDGDGIAVMESYTGYVMARPSPGHRWMRARAKDLLLPDGAQVRTEQGSATIRIVGVGKLVLAPKTRVDLTRRQRLNYLKRSRGRCVAYLVRGEATATVVPEAQGALWLGSEVVTADVLEGTVTLSGPNPAVVSCDAGRATLHLRNGAIATAAGQAVVAIEPVTEDEMRVVARRGHVQLRLSKKRSVAISADGFFESELCPCEVNVVRD